MKLSVVTTLYHSAPYIAEFCRRAADAAQALVGGDYEIILVNDGSPDDSLNVALALHQADPMHIVVVDLSRNFGHHKAIMTGLAHASGDHVFLIDSDLEEAPEWLGSFHAQMQQEHCDVVYGTQERRKGGTFERRTGGWFYPLFRRLTGIDIPADVTTARLMTHRYVEALLLHKEREIFLGGLWFITGFAQRPHAVTKLHSSPSTYHLRHKMALMLNSVTSFSNAPLVLIFYIGAAISALAGIYTLYLVIDWLFFARPMSGWTSVMASIWLLGGLIISFLGIIGIYISKIFSETKQRPYTIIRQVYGRARN